MNAAGEIKYSQQAARLLAVPADILSAITLGSYTLEPRGGNPGNVFHVDDYGTSLNALGLPNPGMSEASRFLREGLLQQIHDSGKRVRVSIAGFSVEEYRELAKMCVSLRVDEIEFNLGCPNVRDGGKQKPIFAFNPGLVEDVLAVAHRVSGTFGEPSVAVKLSPYSDPMALAAIAEVLKHSLYEYMKIVICNTFPNALAYTKEGTLAIAANDGYGGLAGTALRFIALGQVRQFRALLPKAQIIGVGGVATGAHLRDMERAGADEVQVGTAFFAHADPKTFVRIMADEASAD